MNNKNILNTILKLVLTFIVIITCALHTIKAQELNCVVSINTEQLQLDQQRNNQQVYRDLEKIFSDFINNRKWTNDQFLQEEKISCRLDIILTKATAQGDYDASAKFQVSRPVYGTSIETPILNYFDKYFSFRYSPGMQIIYNENTFTDNLTSLLAFYANLALAVDYDSFSKMGGNIYVQKLYNIVNLAQIAGGGWASTNDIRTRYWLAENLQNQQCAPIREGFYTYHRLVLDAFATDPNGGRAKILEYLENINQVNIIKPSSALTRLFFDTKSEELTNLFLEATPRNEKESLQLIKCFRPN